jgi:hypothetical protein
MPKNYNLPISGSVSPEGGRLRILLEEELVWLPGPGLGSCYFRRGKMELRVVRVSNDSSEVCGANSDGESCQDDGNPCTFDRCERQACVHPQKKPTGAACSSRQPQLKFDVRVFDRVAAKDYDPEAVAYTVIGSKDFSSSTQTEVCLTNGIYRAQLISASHSAEIRLLMSSQYRCERLILEGNVNELNYCSVAKNMAHTNSPFSPQTVCWSEECVVTHEKTHAEQWRRIWLAAITDVQKKLANGMLVSDRVCTQEQAEAALKPEIDRIILQADKSARRKWLSCLAAKTPQKQTACEREYEQEPRTLERECAKPKIDYLCQIAKQRGWPWCDACL